MISRLSKFSYDFLSQPKSLWVITGLAFLIRFAHGFLARGEVMYTFIDEVDAWQWSWNLLYYSHATFGTYLPGPWQNILGFILLKLGGTWGFTIFWLALGTAQIPLTAWLLRKFASPAVASAAALSMAILPFSVRYTASFWNPHFIIPLVTLFLGLLFHLAENPRSRWVAAFVMIYALMPFFHFVSAFTVPGALLALWVLKVRPNWRWVALGFVGAVALYFPFAYMDSHHGFFISRGWFHFAGSGEPRVEALKALTNPFVVLFSEPSRFWGYNFVNYRETARAWFGHEIVLWVLVFPSILVTLFGFWVTIQSLRKYWKSPRIKALVIWVSLPTVLFILTRRPHDERYVVIFWPLLFGLSALALIACLKAGISRKSRFLPLFVPAFVVSTLVITAVLVAQGRKPNLRGEVRIPSSLTYIEDLEKIITKASGLPWQQEPLTWPRPVRGQIPSHSFAPPVQTKPPRAKLYLDPSTLDHTLEAGITRRNMTQFERMVDFRGTWQIVGQAQQADIAVRLLPEKSPCPPGWKLAGHMPNATVVIKGKIPARP